jgi:hypothetical protein
VRRLAQMLKRLARNVQVLAGHVSNKQFLSKEEREATFEIFVSMTKFLGDAIQFLRDADELVQSTSAAGEKST